MLKKINTNNSWSVQLIDYFHELSLMRDGDHNINFTKASCTLDGCVKVYTSRVDAVATETNQLLLGLADGHRRFACDDQGLIYTKHVSFINGNDFQARTKRATTTTRNSLQKTATKMHLPAKSPHVKQAPSSNHLRHSTLNPWRQSSLWTRSSKRHAQTLMRAVRVVCCSIICACTAMVVSCSMRVILT